MADEIFVETFGPANVAGDGIRIGVEGFVELDKQLAKLTEAVEEKLLRAALVAGANVAKKAIQSEAPVRRVQGGASEGSLFKRVGTGRQGRSASLRGPGFLKRKGITTRWARRGPNKRLRRFAGPSAQAYYGELVSLGKGGPRGISGGRGFGFVERGWHRSKRAAVDKLEKNLRRGIDREVKRLNNPNPKKRAPRG